MKKLKILICLAYVSQNLLICAQIPKFYFQSTIGFSNLNKSYFDKFIPYKKTSHSIQISKPPTFEVSLGYDTVSYSIALVFRHYTSSLFYSITSDSSYKFQNQNNLIGLKAEMLLWNIGHKDNLLFRLGSSLEFGKLKGKEEINNTGNKINIAKYKTIQKVVSTQFSLNLSKFFNSRWRVYTSGFINLSPPPNKFWKLYLFPFNYKNMTTNYPNFTGMDVGLTYEF